MNKTPIEPTTARVTLQFIVFAFYMIFAILCLAMMNSWLDIAVAALLLTAAYQQMIMSRDEKRAWVKHQADNYSYTTKNQQYARRH